MTKDTTPDINIAIEKSFEVEMQALIDLILNSLDDSKIENIKVIHLTHRSDLASYIIIGTGQSSRNIATTAEKLSDKIKSEYLYEMKINIEGTSKSPQWILVDLQDIMVHLFTQEARDIYDLEKLYTKSIEVTY
jgi:ribosome-associated protein